MSELGASVVAREDVEALADECRQQCVYGVCRRTSSDPYGCGGCCGCLGGCQVTYENTLPEVIP